MILSRSLLALATLAVSPLFGGDVDAQSAPPRLVIRRTNGGPPNGAMMPPGSASTASDSSPGASPTSAPAGNTPPAAPPPLATPALDNQAMGTTDPELLAERKAIEAIRLEKSLIEAELALNETKRRAELRPLVEERAQIEFERGLRMARTAAATAKLESEKATIERKIAVATAKLNEELEPLNRRLRDLETESRALKARIEAATAAPAAAVATRRALDEAARVSRPRLEYPDQPLQDGTLQISDRRIPFNGPVMPALADFVTARIAFYNNQDDKKPIFIVIDNSPGGSVFAGLKILQAMKESKAPVIVVVKQFAASMAAITATSADRSYCYPGTIILHHQMSTGYRGNMTDLRQSAQWTENLYQRTFTPICTKLGYRDIASFEKDMYQHFASGDWLLAGDEAAKRKWVTATAERMIETGITTLEPPAAASAPRLPLFAQGCTVMTDKNGRTRYRLPTLTSPGDAWAIHDPDGVFVSE